MTYAIETSSLAKTFAAGTSDEVQAVRGIDLAIPEGQIYAFLGRNGQGKSTTVRMLTGLTRPTSGTARVGGYDIGSQVDKVKERIGVTLQDVALDDLQTGREHLVLVAQLWGTGRAVARKRASELLDEFGLSAAADRLIRTYSGGMRRRLDLATSLLNSPEILFLDEPTTGLDPQSRRALWDRIRQLRTAGATVFLTTQYLEEADELADELAIIDDGKILARGTPDQLRDSYGITRARLRYDETASHAAAIQALGIAVETSGPWIITEFASTAEASQAIARAVSSSTPDEMDVHTSSLEDVFLSLTGSGIDGTATAVSGTLEGSRS